MDMTATEAFAVLVMASTVGGIIAIALATIFVCGLDRNNDLRRD